MKESRNHYYTYKDRIFVAIKCSNKHSKGWRVLDITPSEFTNPNNPPLLCEVNKLEMIKYDIALTVDFCAANGCTKEIKKPSWTNL